MNNPMTAEEWLDFYYPLDLRRGTNQRMTRPRVVRIMTAYAEYTASLRARRLADNVIQAMCTGSPQAHAAVDAILGKAGA